MPIVVSPTIFEIQGTQARCQTGYAAGSISYTVTDEPTGIGVSTGFFYQTLPTILENNTSGTVSVTINTFYLRSYNAQDGFRIYFYRRPAPGEQFGTPLVFVPIVFTDFDQFPELATDDFGIPGSISFISEVFRENINTQIKIWNINTGIADWSLSSDSSLVSFSPSSGESNCNGDKTAVNTTIRLSEVVGNSFSTIISLKRPIDVLPTGGYEYEVVKNWTFNYTVIDKVSVLPSILGAEGKKNQKITKYFSIQNNTNQDATLSPLISKNWYTITLDSIVKADSSVTGTIDFLADFTGSFSDVVSIEWIQDFPAISPPVSEAGIVPLTIGFNVEQSQIKTIDAGPDLTISALQHFSRDGTYNISSVDETIETKWIAIGSTVSYTSTGNKLEVESFPLPAGGSEYQDHTFEFQVNCSNCSPSFMSDRFTVRVMREMVSSFVVVPDEVDINISDPTSQSVTLSPILTPNTISIIKYTWSDDGSNPVNMVSFSQKNLKNIALSGWKIAGRYQINCEIETSAGILIASAIINITGTSTTTIIGNLNSFPTEDDIYNIEYFIVDNNKELIEPSESDPIYTLDTLQNLSQPVGLTCANPSVCVAHNNRLTGSNEQYIYIAYQAFNVTKWEIHLRQIRLSDQIAQPPEYEYPFSVVEDPYSGIVSYTYLPVNMYVTQYVDDVGENSYITRVVYNLLKNTNYKAVKLDKYGYYKDVTVTITYSGDLSYYWYTDNTLFNFIGYLAKEDGSNLSSIPFDLHVYPPIYIEHPIFGDLSDTNWEFILNEEKQIFQHNKFGYCGTEVADDLRVISSAGNCINPKILCNYDNDLIITYEDTVSGKNQIHLISTGDLSKETIKGPLGSYVTTFYTENDFKFSYSITGKWTYSKIEDAYESSLKERGENTSVNQLPDMVVDKNNVIHLTWQSNRDNQWEIYYANSTNFFVPVRITSTENRSMMPSISVNDDGHIFIVFHDDRFEKHQVFLVYQERERIVPLFQQNEYLASLDNDYSHYIDNMTIPVTNTSDTGARIHVFLKFYDNRLFTGNLLDAVSTRDNPDLFTSENETAISGGLENGVYVGPHETAYLIFLGNGTALVNLNKNQTYFVKLEYLYPDNTITEVMDTHLSYSCTTCNPPSEARWICSGSGYSDTRISYSSENALKPKVQAKSSGRILVLWEDYRFKEYAYKILGANFSAGSGNTDLRSTGGNWFDYDQNTVGKDVSFTLDLFDRLVIAYEVAKSEGTKKVLHANMIGYKVCEFDAIPAQESTTQIPLCDYSNITSNVLTEDPYIGSRYVKEIKISSNDVDYYTRNSSGDSISVVSKCLLKLELTGTPEVIAYRIKNENQTEYSKWIPFKPNIGNYYTELEHLISYNSGLKEICIQAATYSGITASFSIPVIADYSPVPFEVILSKIVQSAEIVLPTYNDVFVVSADGEESVQIKVYIMVSNEVDGSLTRSPYFDFLQQGINSKFGISTVKTTSLPAGMTVTGVSYVGEITVYKHDGRYNSDGLSQIKVHIDGECVSSMSTISSEQTKDIFNYYSKTQVAETVDDVLTAYRNDQTGQIGIVPDYTTQNQDSVFINKYSLKFNRDNNYLRIVHSNDMPIWRNSGYTISFWTKHSLILNLVAFCENSVKDFIFSIGAAGTLSITVPDLAGTTSMSAETVFDNQWHHICWIDNNGSTALYIDAVKDTTNFDYSVIQGPEQNTTTVIGGQLVTGIITNELTSGFIDEFSSWNIALRPNDVISIYNNGISKDLPKKDNLTTWLRMGENTRWRQGVLTIVDESDNDNYGILSYLTNNDIVKEIPVG